MPSIRPALLALSACAALAACGESRQVAGEQGAGECATCHGFPPTASVPLYQGEIPHPQNTACFACHAATVDRDNAILAGGAHLNGVADVRVTSGAACNQCHGMPPPAFLPGSTVTAHPANTDCWVCHVTSVSEGNALVPLEEGGTHYNGVVDVSGGHDPGYDAPDVHGPDANRDVVSCQQCHGTDYAGGTANVSCNACHGTLAQPAPGFADWQTNCTFCHGTQTPGWDGATQLALAAPPEGVDGEAAATDTAVGAHQKHLAGVSTLSAGFGCAECHPPVEALLDPTHIDVSAGAEVQFGARATTGGAAATYVVTPTPTCSATYCHGGFAGGTNAAVTWTSATAMTCASCHPASPTTGNHPAVFGSHRNVACATCHVGFTDAAVDPALHVNGAKDAIVRVNAAATGWDCTRCHSF